MPDQPDQFKIGLFNKDISDWIKIIILCITVIAGYVKLTDRVDQQSQDIKDLKEQVERTAKTTETKQDEMQSSIGSIKMYLASRDKHYYDLQEQNRPH